MSILQVLLHVVLLFPAEMYNNAFFDEMHDKSIRIYSQILQCLKYEWKNSLVNIAKMTFVIYYR